MLLRHELASLNMESTSNQQPMMREEDKGNVLLSRRLDQYQAHQGQEKRWTIGEGRSLQSYVFPTTRDVYISWFI